MTQSCPGQDRRTWGPDDIFELACPFCGAVLEFYRDEPTRACRGCGAEIPNPKLTPGCETWCPAAGGCSFLKKKG